MSSDLHSAVQLQLLNNYVSLAQVTVVIYDYILLFPNEVEHIWSKSWTWVTMLYLIVRYAGIYTAVSESLLGTTFVPGRVRSSFAQRHRNLLNNIFIAISDVDVNQLLPLWSLILFLFYLITIIPMMPRFVISMRELYDKDSRGRLEGIDSTFGISSRSGSVAGRDHSVSGIAFAGVSSRPGEEDGEEIQLEDRGNDA